MERWAELLADPRFKLTASHGFEQARGNVLAYLWEIAELLPSEVRCLLPDLKDLESVEVAQSLVDALDEQYFDLEYSGRLEESGYLFSAARFASACIFFREAKTTAELMNAAYEAKYSQLATDG